MYMVRQSGPEHQTCLLNEGTRTIAVTPSKLNTVPRDQALKISCDYALTALETLASLRGQTQNGSSLRFILMTGHFTPRTEADMSQVLRDRGMADYGLARVRSTPSISW